MVRHGSKYVRVSAYQILKGGEEFDSSISPNPNDPLLSTHSKNKHATTNISNFEAEDDNPPSSYPSQVIENVDISSSNNASRASIVNGQNGPSVKNMINQTFSKASDIILYKERNNDPWTEAENIRCAGSSTGKYSSWININTRTDRNP